MSWQDCIVYRANALMWGVVDGLPTLAMALVWLTVYKSGHRVSGYSLSQMVTYYVVALAVSMLVTPHPEYDLNASIRTGALSSHLVKPFDRWLQLIISESMWQIVKFLMFLPSLAVALVFVHDYITIPNATARLLPFLFSLCLAFLVNVGIKMTLGALAFWLSDTSGIIMVVECVWSILSGEILPLSLLPDRILVIGEWLPFRWVVWFPVELISGRLESTAILSGLAWQMGWAVVTLGISRMVWRSGLRAYSAVGG